MRKITMSLTILAMGLSWVLVGPTPLILSVLAEEGSMTTKNVQEPTSKTRDIKAPVTRIIYGTVEGLTETHIKVDLGEAGEMTPRYLEIEKFDGKGDDLQLGDRLQIVVGAQNLVQDYSKIKN